MLWLYLLKLCFPGPEPELAAEDTELGDVKSPLCGFAEPPSGVVGAQ